MEKPARHPEDHRRDRHHLRVSLLRQRLYGQHQHAGARRRCSPRAVRTTPKFFTATEYETISRSPT